jgi:hypothetical protein
MPFLLLLPLLALKGALVGRWVYRDRLRARADRQFRCRVTRDGGATGHICMPIGTRDLVVYYESSSTADFVVSRRGMKWVSGDPVDVTDEGSQTHSYNIECLGPGSGINADDALTSQGGSR